MCNALMDPSPLSLSRRRGHRVAFGDCTRTDICKPFRRGVCSGSTQVNSLPCRGGGPRSGGGGPHSARKQAGRVSRSLSPCNPGKETVENIHAHAVFVCSVMALPRRNSMLRNGTPMQSPRAAHRTPSVRFADTSPTREAYSRVTEPSVPLQLLRPVDEDTGSPSATVRGRIFANPSGAAHAAGSLK